MNTNEQLLTFPINVKATLAHMKQDMRDDWFSDTLKYEDLFSVPKDLIDTIRTNLELGHGQYVAGTKTFTTFPRHLMD